MSIRDFAEKPLGTEFVVEYGTDLALMDKAEGQLLGSGLWLRVAVRDGRPQLIAIESRDSEHPLTATALRQDKLDKAVGGLIRESTVRIVRDPRTGRQYGLLIKSPTGAGETRSLAERTRDVDEAAKSRKPGRPRLTDAFLRQVAVDWNNAVMSKSGNSASSKLAEMYKVEPATVRQWMFKARKRELVPKEDNDG